MATKIRPGLYEMNFTVGQPALVTYTIEHNPELCPEPGWYIITKIAGESIYWDDPLPTKREAIVVIRDAERGNEWYKHPQLGWCQRERSDG